MSWNVLIVLGCLVGGYVIVSVLMNTKADDLRPPPGRDEPPRAAPPADAPASVAPRALPAPRPSDWSLLLDVPRSATSRDIEAAFRRQHGKAQAAGDQDLVEKLRRARDAALAEKKGT